MGPEEKEDLQLYYKNGDEWKPVDSVKSITVTFNSDYSNSRDLAYVTKTEYPDKMEIKVWDGINYYTRIYPKYLKKMSSKKYKKWLMSIGASRDEADTLCRILGSMRGKLSYADIYATNYNLLLISGESPTFSDILQSIIIKGANKTNG